MSIIVEAAPTLLEVSQLGVEFQTRGGVARVLDDVSFSVHRGETLGLVGESGCGKSMTALAMMRLIPTPPGRITSGRVSLDGRDLLTLSEPEMRQRVT
jgi:ABC-type dipeptide/oligopeptide/nickel transport system ATPase component